MVKRAGRSVGTATPRQPKRKPKSPTTPKATARRSRAVAHAAWRTVGDGTRLLAFDVSSKAVGFAEFWQGALVGHGKYEHVGDGHGERLVNYLDWLAKLFAARTPTAIAVEAPFQGRHRYAFAVLTLYRAALLVGAFRYQGTELPDENQIPAHLIKRVLDVPKGTHTENKAAVVELINALYDTQFRFDPTRAANKSVNDDDVADAVAVGHAWYALHTDRQEDA